MYSSVKIDYSVIVKLMYDCLCIFNINILNATDSFNAHIEHGEISIRSIWKVQIHPPFSTRSERSGVEGSPFSQWNNNIH